MLSTFIILKRWSVVDQMCAVVDGATLQEVQPLASIDNKSDKRFTVKPSGRQLKYFAVAMNEVCSILVTAKDLSRLDFGAILAPRG